MANDALTHQPDGRGNPYEPGPSGRLPLLPVQGDTVRVAVAGSDTQVTVLAEQAGHQKTVAAARVGDHWEAELGPVETSGRYRFTGGDASSTPWFLLPVATRRGLEISGLRDTEDGLEILLDDGLLQLSAVGDAELSLRWRPGRSGAGDPSTTAVVGDWKVELGPDRRVLLRHPECEVRLLAPALLELDGVHVGVELSWALDPGERLYGTGERYDRLDQRRRAPDVRVYEQYKQQGQRTYFPLPWVLSSAGYAIELHTAERVRFDLAAGDPDRAVARIPTDGPVAAMLRVGSPAEILTGYVAGVGRPHPLPLWAYGPWMSGNEWNSDARVREVVERTVAEGIPATAIVVEAWSDETLFYLFDGTEYEPVDAAEPVPAERMAHGGSWPDPKGLVDWVHDQGLAVLLWQIPVLKDVEGHAQHDRDVAHAEANGYCVTIEEGTSYRNRGWWFPGARVIDFTNPDARRWWFTKRAWLIDTLGIDGFKTDGGEHLWGDDVRTHAGETGDVAANRYPTHYLGAYHAFLRDHGQAQPVTFSRAGFTGAQALPAHWAGDEESTWEAYRASLTAGLCAAMSGVAFWSWDLAGFSGPLPSAELYQRSAAMACFAPIMQYHSEFNEHRQPSIDRTPWNVAEQTGVPQVVDTYRFYARLRMNLVPYLNQLGHEAADTGMPILRPMALAFPGDPVAAALDDQYLLGPALLVVPILEPGAERRRLYLPDGDWYDLWTGQKVSPGWLEVDAPVDRIPVFVRGGVALPLWMPTDDLALGTEVGLPGHGDGRLVLLLHPGTGTTRLPDPRAEREPPVTVETSPSGIDVRGANRPTLVWLRPADATHPVGHDGQLEVAW